MSDLAVESRSQLDIPLPNGCWIAPKNAETLSRLWSKLSQFDQLFTDAERGDLGAFVNRMHRADTLIIETLGGVFVADHIRAGKSAQGHLSFWDNRLSARTELIIQLIQWMFSVYRLHRLEVVLPWYAKSLRWFVEKRLGMKHEGIHRDVFKSRGKWVNVHVYSLLEGEL